MKRRPPRLATWLLQRFLRDDLLEDVTGDLEEKFAESMSATSSWRAGLQYWSEVLHYFRPFAIRKFKRTNPSIMYKSYFKSAFRNMKKRKTLAVINVAGLSMGMGVAFIIGLWMWDEITFDGNGVHYDRTAQVIQNVTNNGEVQTWTAVPWPLADELRKNYGADFEQVVLTTGLNDHLVTTETKKFAKSGLMAEPGFDELFSLTMVEGTGNALKDPSSVLISEAAAKVYFGDSDPMNQILKIDEEHTVHVAGIYKDLPLNSTFAGMDFIASWELFRKAGWIATMEDPWRPNAFFLYVRLNDKATFAQASERIRDVKFRKVNEFLQKKKPALFLHPMSEWHLKAEFKDGKNTGGRIRYVWLFGFIGGFVLLMACINFMNLTTARSEHRAKEVGIRKTIGSIRGQLITQFFCESVLIAFISLVIAVVGVRILLPMFNQMNEKQIAIPFENPLFWVTAISFALVTGLVCGSYPALYLSSIQPGKALKGAFRAGKLAGISRKSLVVLQFTISVVLIVGTVTVFQQIRFALNRPIGYNRSSLVSIPANGDEIHKHFEAFRLQMEKTGYVLSVAEAGSPPTEGQGSSSGFDWPGKDPNLSIDFSSFGGSAMYGKTVGWEIKEGRDFLTDNLSDSMSVILNESAVNYMELKDPVGQVIRWHNNPMKVVGVIRDIVFSSPYDPVRPCVYYAIQDRGSFITVRLNPEKSASDALAQIETIFKQYVPDLPFNYQFADVEYGKKFGNEDRIGKLAAIFTALAILISCLGIFGLSSFEAEQRTKEIGIRKVLGATVLQLWGMLSGRFVLLVIISCVVAVPLSYLGLNAWLMNFNYRTAFPWWTIGVASGGTLIITLLTVSYHALYAANVKPAKSLRTE